MSKTIFTINSLGNGTTIQNFTIRGATNSSGILLTGTSSCNIIGNVVRDNLYGIYLYKSKNSVLSGNTLKNNAYSGIIFSNSNNNKIQNNTLTDNERGIRFGNSNYNTIQSNNLKNSTDGYGIGFERSNNNAIDSNILTNNQSGMYLGIVGSITGASNNNLIKNNTVTGNQNGIYLYNSTDNSLFWNTLIGNQYGIRLYTSSANIKFNRIAGNSIYGLYNVGSRIAYATTNWWGSNNPTISSTGGSDIFTANENVTYNPWLVLNITANPVANYNNSIVTADLTHNNAGDDTYPQGNVPDNIPITFVTNLGTITSLAYTRNGKASTTFNRGTSTSGTVNITATLDNQIVQINVLPDATPPTATANVKGGVYNVTQIVNLTATDDLDPNPVIYYTIDGSDPTNSSTIYTSPITFQMNLTKRNIINLKFMAIDLSGNKGLIQNETYILTLPIVNINTNNTYTKIQDAINDPSTLNGDEIEIYSGSYVETVVINKKLTIMPVSDNNVTIQAANPNGNAFTVTNSGNGSIIQGLIIKGNINLQANNCTIYLNTITGYGTSGIIISNSFNNTIAFNTITCNGFNGIQTNSGSNTIYGNTIHGCASGIYSENSNNKITGNDLTNNLYGIWTYNSTDTIQFNRIAQNTYGLRNDIGTVNATNNWWGTNNPTSPSDIWIVSGIVNHTQWLVLSVNPSSTNSGGNSSVTADLTHNNQGDDTTPQGHVPNGIPVNFTTNYGTIIGTSYSVKGKATTILKLGSTQTATVSSTASLDNQTVSTTGVVSTGTAVLTITSTAIDNYTGQRLNTTHTIPLNNSVTWLSVLWINKGMFTDELQIIVDGQVVQDKYFHNTAYTTLQNSYPISVFNAIIFVNQYLQFISSTELTTFWNNITTAYNLTNEELSFVQNHKQEFTDNITVNMVYSGVPGLNLTVTDPHSNVINLKVPGNVIQRTNQVIYSGSPGEGVKSFAIATTDVTDTVLQYWQNQYSSYQTGDALNVAYNTFLTALIVEYVHDRIADNMTTSLNVTWSRTSPAIVSVSEDPYQIYVTLESDHSMGMTVIGTIDDMRVFNFVTSTSISFIEYKVMNSAYNLTFSSVTMDLIYTYLNHNAYVESFQENGFIIVKSILNDNFLVIDLETGMLRDINNVNNLYGAIYEWRKHKTEFGKIYFFHESTKMIGYITLIGYKLFVWQTTNPWDLGTTNFFWDKRGEVYISGNGMFLVDITADNILTITGSNGSKSFSGTRAALDITDILDINLGSGLQTLHLVLTDTDGGFIATSPLYIVQQTIERQDVDLPQIFPCPAPTWPPSPEDEYLPYGGPIDDDIKDFWREFNDFWRKINYTDHSDQKFDPNYRPIKNWGPYDENGYWNTTKYPIIIVPL